MCGGQGPYCRATDDDDVDERYKIDKIFKQSAMLRKKSSFQTINIFIFTSTIYHTARLNTLISRKDQTITL
jgi:hypothetical protein